MLKLCSSRVRIFISQVDYFRLIIFQVGKYEDSHLAHFVGIVAIFFSILIILVNILMNALEFFLDVPLLYAPVWFGTEIYFPFIIFHLIKI